MIQLTCASCGKRLHAKDELAGRMAKCPGCGQPIHIPADSLPRLLGEGPGTTIPLDDAEPGEHVIPAAEEHVGRLPSARAAGAPAPLPDLRQDATGGHVGEQRQRLDARRPTPA